MKGKLALCGLVIMALLLGASPALADGPTLPHAFYGTVTINGADATVGTVVSAKVGGVDCGSYTIKLLGHYGNLPERDYLFVQGDISNGDTITFHVRGILTDTDTFSEGGGPTEKNLTLVITSQSITGKVAQTVPSGQTNYVVDASDIADTTITADTTAEVTVTVKRYYSNPHPEVPLPASMLPRYIDIEVDNADAIVWPMHVEQAYTDAEVAGFDESSLGMYYFKAGAWHRCSVTGVNTAANYVWANMTRDESSGSPVAIGGTTPAPPPPPPAAGDGASPTPAGTTDVRGMVNTEGRFTRSVTATSKDGLCTLTIPTGTVGLTEELEPLTEMTMLIMDEPPSPPQDAYIIGLAYDFSPDGATFDPPINLTWHYDPAALPEGVAEEDMVLAYYDEDAGEWVELDCVVDTENNTITASVPHFTTFAIIGIPPAAFTLSSLAVSPAEVAPGEEVNISVSVANTGGREGSYAVVLKINGVKEAEKSVTITAGSSQSVGFSVAKEEAGSYDVVVDGLSGSFTVVALPAPPPPLAPVAFSLSKLSVKPAEVKPNEPVTITVSVANTGGTEGSYTVVLKINGVKEAEKSTTVAAGESQDVSFTPVTKEQAGSYSVDVDGLSATFTVSEVAPPVPPVPVPTAPPAKPPINWPLAGGIIAAVVVVGLVVFFLVRRRAY